MIKGSLVAVVTPMNREGDIDLPTMRKLIEMHRDAGTGAVVVLGTTGESPTLDHDEHNDLIERCVGYADGKIPIIAGIGSNSTKEAVQLAKAAKQAGAASGLSVVPYYNKPTQRGMREHFQRIAEEAGLPQILYNIPARTVCDMSNETILQLAEVPGIVGVKDATSKMGRLAELVVHAPADFALYAGDDDTAMAFMLAGGHGTISVSANLMPELVRDFCDAAVRGDVGQAKALNAKLLGLNQILGIETNPIPIKYAMARVGLISQGIRSPMTWLDERFHSRVDAVLRELESPRFAKL